MKVNKEDLPIIENAVSHWEKKNDFKFWSNLSDFQRKALTKDLKEHFKNIYLLGRQSILSQINRMLIKEIQKVKFPKRKKK